MAPPHAGGRMGGCETTPPDLRNPHPGRTPATLSRLHAVCLDGDRARIAVSQPYEVSYWSKKFKVTPAKLKAAVAAVGHSSKNVGAYLTGSKKKSAKKKSARRPRKPAKRRAPAGSRPRAKRRVREPLQGRPVLRSRI